MKNKSEADLLEISATQKRKLTAKIKELRDKDAVIESLEKQLKQQLRTLNQQIENNDYLSEQLLKKAARIKQYRKELKVKSTTIKEQEGALEKASAEKMHLHQALAEKDKTHARLNQNIIKANQSGAQPETGPQQSSPTQHLLERIEAGTTGTHQIQGGFAGALS